MRYAVCSPRATAMLFAAAHCPMSLRPMAAAISSGNRSGVHAKAGYGSFGTGRALVMFGPPGEEDGTFAAVELKQSDGFGPNRASASVSAMAQYEARPDERTRITVLGQGYSARFDSAGVVRQDDFLARALPCAADEDGQFFCTYDSNQGGASSRYGLSARLVRRTSSPFARSS